MSTIKHQQHWHDTARIIGAWTLVLALLCGGSIAEGETTTNQQLQKILRDAVANSETNTPGAVLLIQTPDIDFLGAGGLANIETQTPLQPTDMLRIASITKMFVSTIILKLCDTGEISLDDKLSKYLPEESAEIENGADVTIRQLLNMTSGIFDYGESEEYADALETRPNRKAWTPSELLEYVYDEEAYFAPGTAFEYTNTNYILLQMVIEKVRGATLAAELRRLILDPLDMQHTFLEMQETRPGGFGGLLVRGYDTEGDTPEDLTEENDSLGLGDGGLIANAPDLAKFLKALFLDRTLLSEQSLSQMTTIALEEYGLGVEITSTEFGLAWGHEGKTGGFQSVMRYLPDHQAIIVILTNEENNDSNFIDDLFAESLEAVFGVIENE